MTAGLIEGPRHICGSTYEEVWHAGPLAAARLRVLRRTFRSSVSSASRERIVRASHEPGADRAAVRVLVITYMDGSAGSR